MNATTYTLRHDPTEGAWVLRHAETKEAVTQWHTPATTDPADLRGSVLTFLTSRGETVTYWGSTSATNPAPGAPVLYVQTLGAQR